MLCLLWHVLTGYIYIVDRISSSERMYEAVRRCHIDYGGNHDRGDRGFRAGVPLREVAGRAQQTGAAIL